MAWFEKREYVFRKKDKTAWKMAREALEEAGITRMRCGAYDVEPPACGCGAKLDPRDFGKNGRIDRRMFFIKVPVSQLAQARRVISDLE
ncbi:MAG: hypothetical protein U0L91_02675 [Gemmiger sp.]|uniref:hypothetical protein n=1 Tax=Gemmiger sp. TaxID=2049027 RepID=UPI002E76E1D9|nr:hypothetical protein [Gemmiger sp.]MEE0800165.1 hypothetical protein [Gemmiger sp.]